MKNYIGYIKDPNKIAIILISTFTNVEQCSAKTIGKIEDIFFHSFSLINLISNALKTILNVLICT